MSSRRFLPLACLLANFLVVISPGVLAETMGEAAPVESCQFERDLQVPRKDVNIARCRRYTSLANQSTPGSLSRTTTPGRFEVATDLAGVNGFGGPLRC